MSNLRAEWKHFSSPSGKAEGRLIHAENPSGDLIVYVPGFPGGGATLYETHFAKFLGEQEYFQIVLRHNGTLLNGAHSDVLLNREMFRNAVPHHDGEFIGQAPSSIAEWLVEPKVVLESIGGEYTNITLIGHSFGCLAALYSLVLMAEEGKRLIERVRSCVCMAPAIGLIKDHADDVMTTIWSEGFLSSESIWDRIALNGVENIRADLLRAYTDLPERVSSNLQQIHKVFIHAERDEYLKHEDVEEFMLGCGVNSQFVIDKFERHDPRMEYDAHDMPNFPQQILLDLIEGRYEHHRYFQSSDGFILE